MKKETSRLKARKQRRGFVLILVLGILLLITVLVVGFLGHATSQAKTTAGYRDETGSLLLSDIAVNIVKSQIDDAIANTYSGTSLWASQPGAIRIQNSDGTQILYKLYSANQLKETTIGAALGIRLQGDLPASTALANSDWTSSPTWTDLNAPVQKSDKTYAYPIIDVLNDPADLPAYDTAKIVAPFTAGNFNIDTTSTIDTVGALSRRDILTNAGTSNPNTYPLPMPVRWLYVLQQGQVISPDVTATASSTVTFGNAPTAPSNQNPIVGRIAFWADDDTCRVNINTASVNATGVGDGTSGSADTFWDTPKFTSNDDLNLSRYQPANLEYQRYAGHAATTTLSLALPEFTTSGTVTGGTGGTAEALLGITPRYGTGGSMESTILASNISGPVVLPTQRLYASADELLFTPTRAASTLSKSQVETAKFFLTAHSRAPEVNLFGKPRVSIWPISLLNGSLYRTPSDNLIAFCSTINSKAYYFTRQPFTTMSGNPGPAVDGPLEGSNSTYWDLTSNLRNPLILKYLDNLTVATLPGNLGGNSSFDSKYGQIGKRQILTEIFDYIRITNSRDPSLDAVNGGAAAGSLPYSATTAYDATSEGQAALLGTNGNGQITPTEITAAQTGTTASSLDSGWAGTYGFGRYQGIVVGAQIMFMGVGQGPVDASFTGFYQAVNTANISSAESVPALSTGTVTTLTTASGTGGEDDMFYWPPQLSATAINASPNSLNTYAPQKMTTTGTTVDTPVGTAPGPFIPPPGDTAVEAVFCLTFFDPAMGYARNTPWIHANTTNLATALTITPGAGGSPQALFKAEMSDRLGSYNGNVNVDYASMVGANPASLGGLLDFRFMLASRFWTRAATDQGFCGGHSNIINMPTGGTFTLTTNGSITVTISNAYGAGLPPTPSGGTGYPLVHTYLLQFPITPITLPVPGLSTRPIMGTGTNTNDRFSAGTNGSPNNGYAENATLKDAGGYVSTFLDFAQDTIISMVPNAAAGYGDYRMLGGSEGATATPPTAFIIHPKVTAGLVTATDKIALDAMYPSGQLFQNKSYVGAYTGTVTPGTQHGQLVNNAIYTPNDTSHGTNLYGASPVVPITQTGASAGSSTAFGIPPDFDNGFGSLPDGPYINKPDEGAVYPAIANAYVYYDNLGTQVDNTNPPSFYFSPQRQVASPVMFGSLPTGAPVNGSAPIPWQTLLFQPGASGHKGLVIPKDEYLLDLFWMPQAQPYAISEPFSTAGKVNLNYQILPFTYIDRTTAIQSVLSSEKVAEVSSGQAANYKNYTGPGYVGYSLGPARYPLYMSEKDGTLSQFASTFNNFSFFHSAAEICDIYLVPQGKSWQADSTLGTNGIATNSAAQGDFYGPNFALVGDNTREKPYNDIYSRITTKSNSYVVYYRVQALKNPISANQTTWVEGQGTVLGDYRGSTSLERYIDPADTTVPDYAGSAALFASANLETHYSWRVVENTRFAP